MRTLKEVKERCHLEDGHWIWKGAVSNCGPNIHAPDYTNKGGALSCQRGARAVWHMQNKRAVPKGWRVFRACDEPNCVNPAHVRCIEHKEWGREVAESGNLKGSAKRVVANLITARKRSSLSPEAVSLILSSDKTQRELARELGVCRMTIQRVLSGRATVYTVAANPFAGLGGR